MKGLRGAFSRQVREPILVATGLLLLVMSGLIVWQTKQLEAELVESSALESAAQFSFALEQFRSLYTSEVVERVAGHNVLVTHDYSDHDGAIPLPATMSMLLGSKLVLEEGGESALYSRYPFPWRAGEKKDSFQIDAIEALQQDHGRPFYRFEQYRGQPTLRYARAEMMHESCIGCHNTHPDSPKTDWQPGDVRGVLEVRLPISSVISRTSASINKIWLLAGGEIALMVVVALLLGRRVITHLHGEQRAELRLAEEQAQLRIQERVNEEIEANRARQQAIFDVMVEGHILSDEYTRIESVNHAIEHIFGYQQAELIGKNVSLLLGAAGAPAHEQYVANYHHTGKTEIMGKNREILARRKDGSEFPVEITVTEFRVKGQRYFSAMLSDITERKRQEQALRQAKLLAERISEAKSDFLAKMSHEIRMPLNGVIGMISLLSDTELNKDQQRLASLADHSAESLRTIINDILDFSNIEAGMLHIECKVFNPKAMTESVVEVIRYGVEEKQLAIKLLVNDSIPEQVVGDEGRIRQVLNNLLSNAIKFTEQGQIDIALAVVGRIKDTITLRFSVIDTSIGITEDKLALVFDKPRKIS